MAIVHGLVERHGGSIIVDSHPGQGTTFTIFLPGHEGQLEHEVDKLTVLSTGKERILYVDDEPSLAKLGKRHLEILPIQGYQCRLVKVRVYSAGHMN